MKIFSFTVAFAAAAGLLNKAAVLANQEYFGNQIIAYAPAGVGLRNLPSVTSDHLHFLSSGSADAKEGPRDLIIGGTEVQEGDYPYLAYLNIYSSDGSSYSCGGTLIDPNWILTAAHCADTAHNITAWLGVHNISSIDELLWDPEVEVHFISQDDIFIYPGYDSRTTDGDFALLYLSNGSNRTTPVVNYDIFVPAEKDTVWVSGWGITDAYYYLPSVPMEVSLEVVGRDACELTLADIGDITNDMLCATAWGEGDSCFGDSGGPVVLKDRNEDHSKDVLVGVVSWGEGCSRPNRPGIYSRVSAALSWFTSMIPNAQALGPP